MLQYPSPGAREGPEFQPPPSLVPAPDAGGCERGQRAPLGARHPALTFTRLDLHAWEVVCRGPRCVCVCTPMG